MILLTNKNTVMGEFLLTRPEIIWFIIGFVLFIFELILPGFVIFFFGIGAWVTALLCLIADPGINIQVIVFIIVSVISLIALRKILTNKFFSSEDNPKINIDDDFTGTTAKAISSFNAGETGKVEYRGSYWQATSSSDIEEGQEVVITSKKNVKLIVEPK